MISDLFAVEKWHVLTAGRYDLADVRMGSSVTISDSGLASFAQFYDDNVSSILRYFYRRTSCIETASDLTAETFAVAFLKRGSFKYRGRPEVAWLFGIARNQLRRFLRTEEVSKRALKKLELEPPSLGEDDFLKIERRLDSAAVREEVADAFDLLSSRGRVAVEMRVIEGYEYSEIATRLSCSEGAARVQVCRALQKLADRLDGLQ